MEETGQLVRRLTLPYLVLYGLGTIVGAGIYVLIGKVAGRAGMYAPVSFLLAAILALSAAAAYAEMSSRFPTTAAETVFVRQGLGVVPLAIAAGICALVTAVVSSAALAVGFAGYFREGAARQILHHQVGLAAVFTEVIDVHNVRMFHLRQRARFPLEAQQQFFAFYWRDQFSADDLDRHFAL